MGITMIVGRQSQVLSEAVYHQIGAALEAGKEKLYLMVPEQFTLGAEEALDQGQSVGRAVECGSAESQTVGKPGASGNRRAYQDLYGQPREKYAAAKSPGGHSGTIDHLSFQC